MKLVVFSLLFALVVADPVIYYTDIVSGPVTGGEGGNGCYLSVFGKGFGSSLSNVKLYIGSSEVANYRFLGPSKVYNKLGIQQLTVQVGNAGNYVNGKNYAIKIVVNGVASNTDNNFMPNPGKIYFASLTGNDNTGAAGDITKPYRHLQTPTYGGVHAVLRAGDHIVIRGGNWSDLGADNAWFRFRYPDQQGFAPNGTAGTGWIHFTAYPGPVNGNSIEDVHYTTPSGSNKGGIQGANSAYFGTTGDYVTISNLHLEVSAGAESDAAPVNLQYSGGPWRAVNNELGPWPSNIEALAAGVSGHGDGAVVMGNHIHDIQSATGNENHGIYVDSGGSNWKIGYNWIHDITGGNLIQFFDNVGLSGNNYVGFPKNWKGFNGMQVHNNWLENSGKYGLNLADSILQLNIWNNVIIGALFSGCRINTISKGMNITIAFNTFYNNDREASGSGNGQVLNTWGNYNPTGTIRVYDNIFAAGPLTVKGSDYYVNSGADDSYFDFARNVWWDNGYGWGTFGKDKSGIFANPALNADLSLSAGSVAIDNGTQAIPFAFSDDIMGNARSGVKDIGAFEYGSAGSTTGSSSTGKTTGIAPGTTTSKITSDSINGASNQESPASVIAPIASFIAAVVVLVHL